MPFKPVGETVLTRRRAGSLPGVAKRWSNGRPRWATPWGLEAALALLVLLALGSAAAHLQRQGYLPQPFFWNPSDSLMDLYNPAYWAHRDGIYEVWRAVYPPLSFVFLRLTTLQDCYVAGALTGRDCDWLARVLLAAFWTADLSLALVVLHRVNAQLGALRATVLCFGLPMLNGVDRGNLVVATFCFFILGSSDLLPRPWRWLSMAVAINLKPYLAVQLVPWVLTRNWRALGGVGLATVLVYGASLIVLRSGWPTQLLSNSAFLMATTQGNLWNNLYDATSYHALIQYVRVGGPVALVPWMPGLRALIFLGQAGVAACFLLTLKRQGLAHPRRLLALSLAFVMSSFAPSGYIEIFLIYICFQEGWKGVAAPIVIVSAYLLCVPFDYVLSPVRQNAVFSYWGGRLVTPEMGLALGQILRPGLILLIQYGYVALTLGDQLRGSRARQGLNGAPPDGTAIAAENPVAPPIH